MKYKKAFTLVEVIISIVLFSIIVLFLYQALDMTKKSNEFFNKKVDKVLDNIELKKLVLKDMVLSTSIKPTPDKEKRTILALNSSNTYHDAFYTNITYLVSKEDNLIRIESYKPFKQDKLNYTFFDNAYIDTIAKKVKKFKVVENKDKSAYSVYIEFEDKTFILFSVKSLRARG